VLPAGDYPVEIDEEFQDSSPPTDSSIVRARILLSAPGHERSLRISPAELKYALEMDQRVPLKPFTRGAIVIE